MRIRDIGYVSEVGYLDAVETTLPGARARIGQELMRRALIYCTRKYDAT